MMDDRIYLFAVLDPGQAVQKVVSALWVCYSSAATLLTLAPRVPGAHAGMLRKRR